LCCSPYFTDPHGPSICGFHLLQAPQGVSEFISEYRIVIVLCHNKIEGLFRVTGSCMHE